jgi:hypothetical protein
MFGKVFAIVFFVTIPAAHGFQDSRPQSGSDAPVEVGVLLESSAIRIRNFSSNNQVLIFENNGFKIYRTLSVGMEFDWAFTPGTLSGVSLEVASLSAGQWRYTGSLSLDDYAASGCDTLWVQPFVPHSLAWLQTGSTFSLFAYGPSFLPTYLQDCTQGTTTDMVPNAAIHVPGPIDSGNTPIDGPPKLDKPAIPPM